MLKTKNYQIVSIVSIRCHLLYAMATEATTKCHEVKHIIELNKYIYIYNPPYLLEVRIENMNKKNAFLLLGTTLTLTTAAALVIGANAFNPASELAMFATLSSKEFTFDSSSAITSQFPGITSDAIVRDINNPSAESDPINIQISCLAGSPKHEISKTFNDGTHFLSAYGTKELTVRVWLNNATSVSFSIYAANVTEYEDKFSSNLGQEGFPEALDYMTPSTLSKKFEWQKDSEQTRNWVEFYLKLTGSVTEFYINSITCHWSC